MIDQTEEAGPGRPVAELTGPRVGRSQAALVQLEPHALFPQPLSGDARFERETDAVDRKTIRGHASNHRIDPDHPPFSIQEWPAGIPTVQSGLGMKHLLAFHAVNVIDFGADHPSSQCPQSTL